MVKQLMGGQSSKEVAPAPTDPNLAAAQRRLEEALHTKVDIVQAKNRGGRLVLHFHNDEELEHLERAVHLQPTFAAAHLNLGTLRMMRGELAAAERSLKEAVALEPTLATAHAHLGILYQRTGRPDLSRAALTSAHRLHPDRGQPPPR